jgi:hypothetical protein
MKLFQKIFRSERWCWCPWTLGLGFQLAALWFPLRTSRRLKCLERYVASLNMAAHNYLPILHCYVNSSYTFLSIQRNTSAFLIYGNRLQNLKVGNSVFTQGNLMAFAKLISSRTSQRVLQHMLWIRK